MLRLIIGIIISFAATNIALAEGDANNGKTHTAICAACHGADGNSAAGTFPSLAGQGEKYLIKQMQDIKNGKRPVAMMMGQLDAKTDQEIADIAAHFASQTIKQGTAKQAMVEEGEQIYRWGIKRKGIAACSSCHLPNGEGLDSAGFPALAGQWPEYIIKQLKDFRVNTRTNDGDARMMQSVALDLSDREIEAVANYIHGLR